MKTLLRLTSLLAIPLLLAAAEPADNDKEALVKTMHSFTSGLELIQKGILYNKTDKILDGVAMIKKYEADFVKTHGKSLEKHMPDNPELARSYAVSAAKKISRYTGRISREIVHIRDYSKIAATYTHILHECVGCHQKIRRWKP